MDPNGISGGASEAKPSSSAEDVLNQISQLIQDHQSAGASKDQGASSPNPTPGGGGAMDSLRKVLGR